MGWRDEFFELLSRDKVKGRAGARLALGWNLLWEQQRRCPGMSQHPPAVAGRRRRRASRQLFGWNSDPLPPPKPCSGPAQRSGEGGEEEQGHCPGSSEPAVKLSKKRGPSAAQSSDLATNSPFQIPSPQRLLACLEISPLRGPRSLTMSPSGSGLWAAELAQAASSGRPGLTSCSLPPSACPRPPRVPAAPAAPPGGSPR